MTILEQLKRDEGFRNKPYRDTVGKLTVGYGRNLDDVGISEPEAAFMLANDIQKAEAAVTQRLPWTVGMDDARRAVLIEMALNMGIGGLLKFKKMLIAAMAGQHHAASTEMLDSDWAKQIGARATRLALQMTTGLWT